MLLQEQKSVAEDPGRALNLGVGLVSPLWPTFLATAGAGVAWWWWTQWTQVQDRSFAPLAAAKPFLKLVEAAPSPAPVELAPVEPAPVESALEAAAETAEAVSETAQEVATMAEAAVEQVAVTASEETALAVEAVAPVVEETVEAVQAAAPAVVEPVEAVAEAVTPPAPRKRPVAAKSGAARASAPKPPARAGKRTRTPE